MEIALSFEQVQSLIGESLSEGQTHQTITGIASLDEAQPGDLTFLDNLKYQDSVANSKASVVLLPLTYQGTPKLDQAFLRVRYPSQALAKVCGYLEQRTRSRPSPGIHPSAVIDPKAQIDETATIGPLCVVQQHARVGARAVLQSHIFLGSRAFVGDHSWLMPHVTVMDNCHIGERVRLNPGVVIGSEGFGYSTEEGRVIKEPQVGAVTVQDDVEIGANTTIDRARFDQTLLQAGTKIDNLVQIAHNVRIGKNCLIASQAGIAGSTVLEEAVMLGGQAGLTGHVTIGKGAKIAAQAGVANDIKSDSLVTGTPAMPLMLARRIDALKKQLPDLFKRTKKIENFIETLHLKDA